MFLTFPETQINSVNSPRAWSSWISPAWGGYGQARGWGATGVRLTEPRELVSPVCSPHSPQTHPSAVGEGVGGVPTCTCGHLSCTWAGKAWR